MNSKNIVSVRSYLRATLEALEAEGRDLELELDEVSRDVLNVARLRRYLQNKRRHDRELAVARRRAGWVS